jgi:hypothetical protein
MIAVRFSGMKPCALLLSLSLSLVACSVPAQESLLRNPLDVAYADELVRLKTPAPDSAFVVTEEGKPIAYQVEGKSIWICSTFPPQSSRKYAVAPGKPAKAEPRVKVTKSDAFYELDNGLFAVRVPAQGTGGPIAGVRIAGQWVGASSWKRAPSKLTSTVLGDGTLFGKVRLRYEFDGGGWAEIDVTVAPGWPHAVIEERHEMARGDFYEIDLSKGWLPSQGVSRPYAGGFQKIPAPQPNRSLLPGGQPFEREELYISLIPRWNQSCQDGWFFAATGGTNSLGALVTRASRWFWPHDNAIDVVVKASGDYAGLRCPTWHGARLWMLTTGPGDAAYVTRYALESLDKLNHEIILDWPGHEGKFEGFFPYSNAINPTDSQGTRGLGSAELKQVAKPGDYGRLTKAQMMMHPDCYGSYYLHWSPENPNFYSDYMKGPIAMICRLREHPRFKELAALAESKLREDVDHSITLPGGAGQECPGYQGHGSEQWKVLAPVCREYLGFDPTEWERVKASTAFLQRISQPDGDIRRMLPMGDTHPAKGFGPRKVDVAGDEVKSWVTSEFPGFGAIFQYRAGTADETYLAFKSGPNRGHYHGDQLAFHFGAHGRPLAVDHHASYSPRPGQEHMHNRVAFGTDAMPWANMDGYERLIAFKTSAKADVAIGQVESDRLRQVIQLPPEDWNAEYPQLSLSGPLTYRRTIVFVKGGEQDYFLLRDQFSGADELNATYCLHVRSDKAERDGQTIDFGNLTLFCAAPATFKFDRLDWSHGNGVAESTVGARLTIKGKTGEFITVLYPGKLPTVKVDGRNVTVGTDTIRFGDDGGVLVKRDGAEILQLTAGEINVDRSQGDIGLFVPDVGYPFGQIPDWLIRQRAAFDHEAARKRAWPLSP